MSNAEVLICFSLIALWFNAMLGPFKLFITVVVPVTWTYGAAFYVYEDGALSWLGIPGPGFPRRLWLKAAALAGSTCGSQ